MLKQRKASQNSAVGLDSNDPHVPIVGDCASIEDHLLAVVEHNACSACKSKLEADEADILYTRRL